MLVQEFMMEEQQQAETDGTYAVALLQYPVLQCPVFTENSRPMEETTHHRAGRSLEDRASPLQTSIGVILATAVSTAGAMQPPISPISEIFGALYWRLRHRRHITTLRFKGLPEPSDPEGWGVSTRIPQLPFQLEDAQWILAATLRTGASFAQVLERSCNAL